MLKYVTSTSTYPFLNNQQQTIGIVVGTLGVERYREGLEQLKAEIKKGGRKGYVFVVGKLNVPKLANFPEIECFVLLSCPLHSMIDSKEYFAPVITPFELLLALNPTTKSAKTNLAWNGTLITDFRELLTLKENTTQAERETEEEEEEEVVHQSLFTNKIKSFKASSTTTTTTATTSSDNGDTTSSDIMVRGENNAIATQSSVEAFSTGARYLSQRSFRGLGHTDDESEIVANQSQESFSVVTEGLSGIPMHYANDIEMHK